MDGNEGPGSQDQDDGGAEVPPSAVLRMARLRDAARRGRHLELLLEDVRPQTKARGSHRKAIAFGSAGLALLGVAAIVAAVAGGAGSRASAPPVATSTSAEVSLPGVPTAAPTTRAVADGATPAVNGGRGDGVVPEGAVEPRYLLVGTLSATIVLTNPLMAPAQVVDRFGAARGDFAHAGVDLSLPGRATFDAWAACDGTVVTVSHLDGYGDLVVVDCGNNWRTVYARLARIDVKPGQQVAAALSVIGGVSDSLHFEVRLGGMAVDPEPLVDFKATPTPTPADLVANPDTEETATATATATRTPTRPGATATPTEPGASPEGGSTGPAPTATPPPPTATATATATATPTPTVTPTPTPRPPTPTPTQRPVIR